MLSVLFGNMIISMALSSIHVYHTHVATQAKTTWNFPNNDPERTPNRSCWAPGLLPRTRTRLPTPLTRKVLRCSWCMKTPLSKVSEVDLHVQMDLRILYLYMYDWLLGLNFFEERRRFRAVM